MGLRNIINQPSEIATRGSKATQRTRTRTRACVASDRHVAMLVRYAVYDMRWHPRSLAATRAACVAICNYVITQTCNSICSRSRSRSRSCSCLRPISGQHVTRSPWHIALIALNCPTRLDRAGSASSWRLQPTRLPLPYLSVSATV